MDETLQQKIKSVIAKKGWNYKRLAEELGVSINNMYKWKDASNPRDHKEYEMMVKKLDDLLAGTSDTRSEDPRRNYITQSKSDTQPAKPLLVSIHLSDEDDSSAYTAEKAVPGSVITINGKPALIAYGNNLPLIGEVDGLISVPDESMEPRYKSGSWIAIKKLKYTRIINAGFYYYIIDKNNEALLRKVRTSGENNSITLLSENETIYPAITRSMDDILAIFSVKAVVIK
jgi:phage repressor protein C with HTH and peptisase S24 domain